MDSSVVKNLMGGDPSVEALSGSGSNRKYFRLTLGNRSAIGVVGTSLEENEAFLSFDKSFREIGLPMPEIYAVSPDRMAYLQEDLGNQSLFDIISAKGDYHDLLAQAVTLLPKIQFEGSKVVDFGKCYPIADFSQRAIFWDLNYFKYCFLKACGIEFDENRLEDDFHALAEALMSCDSHSFMYRDFQSRNIMVRDGKVHFIDFQGGRKGPFYYDIVSLLWQARANFRQEERMEMLKLYHSSLQQYHSISFEEFMRNIHYFVLFRTMQVLGAYGFRGFFEKKAHFVQSVPFALNNLRELLKEEEFSNLPYLTEVLHKTTECERFATEQSEGLTVKVRSFSFKKGYPDDNSGNGGGFVFDCRALHNPGRYAEYRPFTGMDQCVIDFIEEEGGMQKFLENVYSIVDASVKKYMERGFTSLMVNFGCTGGRHRSVYAAQHLADHVYEKFNVRVDLEHIEQKVKRIYTPQQ